MRKLILQMQTSVDGYVAAANSNFVWQVWDWKDDYTWDDKLAIDFNAVFDSIDCILLSRKMMEGGYLDHWTQAAKKFPADPRYAFAQKIVDTNKVVLTNKLDNSKWDRTALATGSLVDEIDALKQQPGQDVIAFGGVGFASSLVAEGLVDEFQFFVNPTAVAAGRSIFRNRDGTKLRLIRSNSYDCGIVLNRYAPN